MRLIALAAASLLGGLFHPVPKPTTTQVYGLGEWRLTVVTDTFTKEVRCRLENRNGVHPDVVAVPGALAFKLGRGVDTADAWYKLDDQPARPRRDLRAELVATGSLVEAERLDNPSGGWVVMPVAELTSVQSVSLRSAPGTRPRIFVVGPTPSLIEAAKTLQCNFQQTTT